MLVNRFSVVNRIASPNASQGGRIGFKSTEANYQQLISTNFRCENSDVNTKGVSRLVNVTA